MSEQLEKIATGIASVVEKQTTFEASLKSIQEENANLKSELEAKNKDITELKSNVETIDTKMKKSARFGSFENTNADQNSLTLIKDFDIESKYANCISSEGSQSRQELSNMVVKNYEENKTYIKSSLSKKYGYNFDHMATKSLSTLDMSSIVDGGMYAQPIEFLPEIEQVYQENPLLSQITTYVISGKEAKIPYIARRGEVFALKEGESVDSTKHQFKTPTLVLKTISVNKWGNMITMTDEDYEVISRGNGRAFMSIIDTNRVETLKRQQSVLLINGDASEPMKQQGLLTPFANNQDYVVRKPFDHQANKVGKIITANAGSVVMDDIIHLTTRTLMGEYKAGAFLTGNSNTLAYLSTLKDDVGQYHFRPQGNLNGVVVPATINGIQFLINDDMPDIASGVVPIIYGNFKQAIIQVRAFNDTILQLSKTDGDNAHYKVKYTSYFGSSIMNYQSFRYLEVA